MTSATCNCWCATTGFRMSPDLGWRPGTLASASAELIEEFRDHCRGDGYTEARRVGLARHHDPSIRFTNSTISVLKPYLDRPVERPVFLVQPAVRLQNLSHWLRYGRMSGFGCHFIALGTLSPPDHVTQVHRAAVNLLTAGWQVAPERVVLRTSSADDDLCRAAAATGRSCEVNGCPVARYRHVFGMDGVTGRNTNIAIVTDSGLEDVANVIVIEHAGRPVAIETAYGVNTVLARRSQLAHPVLASIGAVARSAGVAAPMTLDALGTSVALVTEGLRPIARGRGGRLRLLLKIVGNDATLSPGALPAAVRAVVDVDQHIREHLSPAEPGLFTELVGARVVDAVVRDVEELAGTS